MTEKLWEDEIKEFANQLVIHTYAHNGLSGLTKLQAEFSDVVAVLDKFHVAAANLAVRQSKHP